MINQTDPVAAGDWGAAARGATLPGGLFVGGEERPAVGDRRRAVRTPRDGSHLVDLAWDDIEDAHVAVAAGPSRDGQTDPARLGDRATDAARDNVLRLEVLGREELFGPVWAVQIFADEDEALEIASDTDDGLAAAVWSNDLGRAPASHGLCVLSRSGSTATRRAP